MKTRPKRAPDFTFTTKVRRNGNYEAVRHACYWKEAIVVVFHDNNEYVYDVVQTEFGRIDMRFDDVCNSISWVKGLRESYEQHAFEEIVLND